MENKKILGLTDIQKKDLVNSFVDGKSLSYSIAVKSHRTKLIQEGYLTSKNQIQVFDSLLIGLNNDLKTKNNLPETLFVGLLAREQTDFIENLVKLFDHGWKAVKAYNFYTQRGNTYKYSVFFNVVKKQDKTDFEELGFIEVKKNEKIKTKKPTKHKKTEKDIKITYK